MISLCLASGSPRRRELLSLLGWPFSVMVPRSSESLVPGEKPEDAVVRLASEKARSVAPLCSEGAVVAADTVVVLDGEILGKPRDKDDAFSMIKRLEGRSHRVMTGIALSCGARLLSRLEVTTVVFRSMSERQIRSYVRTGEGLDKAGAYGIQGQGALLVQRIDGDYFNVVGLPLYGLSLMMEAIGISLPDQWGTAQ